MSESRIHRIRTACSQRLRPVVARVLDAWKSPLGRAAVLAVLLTVVCKVIGFFRESLVASAIGIDRRLDVFHVANLISMFAINVLNQNVASSLVMRVIRERTQKGVAAGQQLFRESLFWGMLIAVIVSVAGPFLGPALLPILSPGFSPDLFGATERMLWMLVPYSIFSGVAIFWSTMLNAEGGYVASSLNPGVVSVGVSAGLMFASGGAGIDLMILGLTGGSLASLILLGCSMRARGLPVIPRCAGWSQVDTSVLWASLPLIASSLLHFGTDVVDQSMASILGPGSISELKYGNRIVGMVFGVLAIPITQVVFPILVRLVEEQNWRQLQRVATRSVLVSLLFSVPMMVVLIVFSHEIVSLSFERGKFTQESVIQVSAVQVMYAFQLPFYLWGLLMVRLAVALRLNRVMLVGGVLNLSVNVAMNYVLMKPLGVTGIALSTGIVYLGAACYFSAAIRVTLRRKVREQMEIDAAAGVVTGLVDAPRMAA